MRKRVLLAGLAFVLAAGAAFATNTKSTGDQVYQTTAHCPEITSCTTTNTGNVCAVEDQAYQNSNCTSLVDAFQRP